MAQCATTALAGAVPRPCVRGARGRFGRFGPVPGVVSPPFPPSRPACPALRVAGRPVRVSLTLARWYAIPRGQCVLGVLSGCPSGSTRVPFACVCARAPAASASPPPLGGVACAPCAVPALGAGRAVPRGPCPSACPAPVPCSVWRAWGGAVRSRFPPTWLGVVAVVEGRPLGGCLPLLRGASGVRRSPSPGCPPAGRAVGVRYPRAVGATCGCGGQTLSPWPARPVGAACRGGGGGPSSYLAPGCAPPVGRVRGVRVPGGGLGGGGGPCPLFVRPGGACRAGGRSALFRPSAFPGQATKRVSLASFWSWGAWPPIHSGSRSPAFTGRDLCGVLARWRGLACSPRFLREPAAGEGGGACSGSSLGRGEGGPSSLPRGVKAGTPAACGPAGGGGGGGVRAAASLLPLWVAARGSLPWPPSCRRRTPPRRARAVGVSGPRRGGGG